MGSVPVGRKKRADTTGGPQTFRSPTAVVIWWVWLLFAAANLIDLAVQGRDHLSLVAAAILVLATGVAYVTAQRPRIVADSSGITVVNPLRDHHVGWAGVTKVDLADLLRVHCRGEPGQEKIIYAWAVHYSRRRKLAGETRVRRQAARASSGRPSLGTFGLGSGYGSGRRDPGFGSPPGPRRRPRRTPSGSSGCSATTRPPPGPRRSGPAAPWRSPAPGPGPRSNRLGSNPLGSNPLGLNPLSSEPAGLEPAGLEPAGDAAADSRIAGWLEPLTSTWDRTALLALLIPALILLAAILF